MNWTKPLGGETRWLSDARLRRAIAEAVQRRRARRKCELAAFELAIRRAEQSGKEPK